MWLKNSLSCNSCQSGGFLTQPNRSVLRKSLLSTEIKEESMVFLQDVFHTQTLFFQFLLHSSCQISSFFRAGQNWNTRDCVGNVDATLHTGENIFIPGLQTIFHLFI